MVNIKNEMTCCKKLYLAKLVILLLTVGISIF